MKRLIKKISNFFGIGNREEKNKKRFKQLAGIGQPKNQIDPEIWKYVAYKVSKDRFPEPDKSITVSSQRLTTIGGSYGDSDPLASVPLSRVSKEAKKKMAEIAKDDINKQLEEKTANIHPNDLDAIETVLGNINKMPDEIKEVMKEVMIMAPIIKPKRKYTKKATK